MATGYRSTIEESNYVYPGSTVEDPLTTRREEWMTIDHIQTTDKQTVAAALRGIANRYDPPKVDRKD